MQKMQNPQQQSCGFCNKLEERKNEKDEEELFIYIVDGNCEEKK